MCVICVKKKGVRLPTLKEVTAMWEHNPDGAGFMYARDGILHLEKGFMKLHDLIEALNKAGITEDDPLIIHFRISTQGGIRPEMTHPFPVHHSYKAMEVLQATPKVALAHNGIISRCCKTDTNLSDTALFVTKYVSELVRKPSDINRFAIKEALGSLASFNNKLALMNDKGDIALIGDFVNQGGLLYSNLYHQWTAREFNGFYNYPRKNCDKECGFTKADKLAKFRW